MNAGRSAGTSTLARLSAPKGSSADVFERFGGCGPLQYWGHGITALIGASVLWAMSGTGSEQALVGAASASIRALEQGATAHPADPVAAHDLAQAYLDEHQPGLAVVWIEGAEPSVRGDVRVRHVLARALVDQGRDEEALARERQVVAGCESTASGGTAPAGCDSVLLASAVRRVNILQALVALGIEDAQAQPEASLVAYRNATREARVQVE